MNQQPTGAQRGDVAIFTALIVMTIMIASALALNGLLSRQARLSQEIVAAERAFYGANSGLEQALYQRFQANENVIPDNPIKGTITYDAFTLNYEGYAYIITTNNPPQLCSRGTASLQRSSRTVVLGSDCSP